MRLLLVPARVKPGNKVVQSPSGSRPGKPGKALHPLPSVPAQAHQTKAQTQSPSATMLERLTNSVVALY
jgi:hypothetical protein